MQEYVETAKKVVTKATKKVVKKSSEIYELSKLSLKINAAKAEIEERYAEIGKMIYESYKDDTAPPEKLHELCEKIDGKFQLIEELSLQLAELKNVQTCPQCGAQIMKNSVFCAKCGKEL